MEFDARDYPESSLIYYIPLFFRRNLVNKKWTGKNYKFVKKMAHVMNVLTQSLSCSFDKNRAAHIFIF